MVLFSLCRNVLKRCKTEHVKVGNWIFSHHSSLCCCLKLTFLTEQLSWGGGGDASNKDAQWGKASYLAWFQILSETFENSSPGPNQGDSIVFFKYIYWSFSFKNIANKHVTTNDNQYLQTQMTRREAGTWIQSPSLATYSLFPNPTPLALFYRAPPCSLSPWV